MDYLTNWTPDDVLDAAELHFARDWPYGGNYSRTRFSVNLTATQQSATDRLGCIGMLVSMAVWFVTLGFKDLDEPTVRTAQVFATPSAEGTTISVRASEPHWQNHLEQWAVGGFGYTESQ